MQEGHGFSIGQTSEAAWPKYGAHYGEIWFMFPMKTNSLPQADGRVSGSLVWADSNRDPLSLVASHLVLLWEGREVTKQRSRTVRQQEDLPCPGALPVGFAGLVNLSSSCIK